MSLWMLIDENSDAIVAVCTLVLALVTSALAWYTYRLRLATSKMTALAHKEFIASHRPRIHVHNIEAVIDYASRLGARHPNEEELGELSAGAKLLCVNDGESTATITHLEYGIFMTDYPMHGLGYPGHLVKQAMSLDVPSGTFATFTLSSGITAVELSEFEVDQEHGRRRSEKNRLHGAHSIQGREQRRAQRWVLPYLG